MWLYIRMPRVKLTKYYTVDDTKSIYILLMIRIAIYSKPSYSSFKNDSLADLIVHIAK